MSGSKAGAAAGRIGGGPPVMLYRISVEHWHGGTAGPVKGAGEAIATIEADGWALDQMAYDVKQSAVLLLFRRPRVAQPPQDSL